MTSTYPNNNNNNKTRVAKSTKTIQKETVSSSIYNEYILPKLMHKYKHAKSKKQSRKMRDDMKTRTTGARFELQSRDEQNTRMWKWIDKYFSCYTPAQIKEKSDYVSKIIEDISILIRGIVFANTRADYAVAIVTYTKLRIDGPLFTPENLAAVTGMFNEHFNKLLEFFDHLFGGDDVQSSDGVFASVRSYLDKYEEVRNAPVFKKLHKFVMYALSLSLFDKAGLSFDSLSYSKLEAEAIRRKHFVGPDLVHTIADTLLFLCERGQQCIRTGSMEPIYHSGERYEKWFDRAQELMRQSLFLSNPEPHGIDRFGFLADLLEAIEQGEAIYKHAVRLGETEKKVVKKLLSDLIMVRCNETTKRSALKSRKAPFAVLLYGGSSVAKSLFSDLLFSHYGTLFNLPKGAEFKYTRNANEPHWNGFNSAQWGVCLDDIAYMKPAAAMGGDPSVMEMLQVVNNVAFVPAQADLPDKGKTPMRARLVIATTNTEHINAHAYFSCPLAIQRRLPYIIDIKPKPQFARGCMIDSDKLPEVAEGDYPDFWLIEVKKIVPKGTNREGQMAVTEKIESFGSIYAFIAWFSKVAQEHEKTQTRAMDCGDTIRMATLCETCFIPEAHCVCEQIQARDSHCDVRRVRRSSRGRSRVRRVPEYRGHWSPAPKLVLVPGDGGGLAWEELPPLIDENSDFYESSPEREISRSAPVLRDGVYRAAPSPSPPLSPEPPVGIASDEYFDVLENSMQQNLEEAYKKGWIDYWFTHLIRIGMFFFLEYTIFREGMTWLYSFPICKRLFWYFCAKRINNTRMMRYFFQRMGTRIQGKIGHIPMMAFIAAAITTGVVAYKAGQMVYRCFGKVSNLTPESVELPPEIPEERAPVPCGVERVNVWRKDSYQTTSFDVDAMNTSYLAFPIQEVQNMLLRNCVTFISHFEKTMGGTVVQTRRPTRATCVAGHVYMCNNHGIPDTDAFDLEIIACAAADGVTTNIRCRMTQADVRRFPESDLAFVRIRNLPPKKTLIRLFSKASLSGGLKGTYLSRLANGEVSRKNVAALKKHDGVVCEQLATTLDTWFGSVDEPTTNGDCGSLLLADSAFGPVILGIHYLGSALEKRVGAIAVTCDMVAAGINAFDDITVQAGEPLLSAPSVERALGELHYKSPVRFFPEGSAAVYGSFTGFRPKHKSSVCPTLICESMKSRGVTVAFGPPVMEGWEPWHIALQDMLHPVVNIRSDILQACVSNFTKDILDGLDDESLSQVHVYDDDTAVNGATGVAYVDKINRGTSAGNPWKKSKKYFMKAACPRGTLLDPVDVDEEIMDRVRVCEAKYKAGERYMPVFCAHLKDEGTKFAKIKAKKTRVFTGAPFCWTIVVRKYLLSVVRVVQNNRFLFESAPGTVAQSLEWQQIRTYLTKHGDDRLIAGDYGSFDKSMPPCVILAAFDIVSSICRAAGYSDDALAVVSGIAADTAFPLVDFNGDLIEFFGSNPSGHPLTVIINGLANALYMRYCYAILSPAGECSNFKRDVSLMTYGDDNAMGVSKDASFFNHTAIQGVLARVGIKYTMADKESASVPYINIADVSFLKRFWRFDKEVGAYLCPLEETSIEKMLTVCVKSKTITMEEQAIAVIETAVREYFFYGRARFELESQKLREVMMENHLEIYVQESTFPSWDQLRLDFWANSNHIKLDAF